MAIKNINWYLENPKRLLEKKSFWRGGDLVFNESQNSTYNLINSNTEANLSTLKVKNISQDIFYSEYYPSLHSIHYNENVPKIRLKYGSMMMQIDDDIRIASAYQKQIHDSHVRSIAVSKMNFTLLNIDESDEETDFIKLKKYWEYKNMETVKHDMIFEQEKVGDVAVVLGIINGKLEVKVLSFPEYVIVPNYDEFNNLIAVSFRYVTSIDDINIEYIDTYTDKYFYRHKYEYDENNSLNDCWVLDEKVTPHKFSQIPVIYVRGDVAWENSQSSIVMYELVDNIHNVLVKRLGLFGMKVRGSAENIDAEISDAAIVVTIEDSESKDDVEILKFPSYEGFIEHKNHLEEKIFEQSSVSRINARGMGTSGNIGSFSQLLMLDSIGLANQKIKKWSYATNKLIELFAEGMTLETNINFSKLKIKALLSVWIPESDAQKMDNMAKATWISDKTKCENTSFAAVNEYERLQEEKQNDEKIDTTKTIINEQTNDNLK